MKKDESPLDVLASIYKYNRQYFYHLEHEAEKILDNLPFDKYKDMLPKKMYEIYKKENDIDGH